MSIKGDFISFTYNGVHSTELGIVRTSSSNRYNDQLVPTSQDKTVPVPGGNGTYFFGSYYTQRAITLDIAYDEVTEETLRRMRKVFESDTVHPLIFDDEPYKVYYAKVTGQPTLKYIPFQNYDSEFLNGTPRIYKGEGTINFTCYDPFAHCPWNHKYLNLQWDASVPAPPWYKYENKDEWGLSAHLLSTWEGYDNHSYDDSQYVLYNPGDVEADFQLIIPFNDCKEISSLTLQETDSQYSESLYIDFSNINIKSSYNPSTESVHVNFNSKNNLLEEMIRDDTISTTDVSKQYRKTGKIYNEALKTTVWFKIPIIETVFNDEYRVATGLTPEEFNRNSGSNKKYFYMYDEENNVYQQCDSNTQYDADTTYYVNNQWWPVEEWKLIINFENEKPQNWHRPTLYYDYLYY